MEGPHHKRKFTSVQRITIQETRGEHEVSKAEVLRIQQLLATREIAFPKKSRKE